MSRSGGIVYDERAPLNCRPTYFRRVRGEGSNSNHQAIGTRRFRIDGGLACRERNHQLRVVGQLPFGRRLQSRNDVPMRVDEIG